MCYVDKGNIDGRIVLKASRPDFPGMLQDVFVGIMWLPFYAYLPMNPYVENLSFSLVT